MLRHLELTKSIKAWPKHHFMGDTDQRKALTGELSYLGRYRSLLSLRHEVSD